MGNVDVCDNNILGDCFMLLMVRGGICGGLVVDSVGVSVVGSFLSWLVDEDDDIVVRSCDDVKLFCKSKEFNILFFNILDKKILFLFFIVKWIKILFFVILLFIEKRKF